MAYILAVGVPTLHPSLHPSLSQPAPVASIAGSGSYFPKDYAPCASDWATAYLSRKDVQLAVHADPSGIATAGGLTIGLFDRLDDELSDGASPGACVRACLDS